MKNNNANSVLSYANAHELPLRGTRGLSAMIISTIFLLVAIVAQIDWSIGNTSPAPSTIFYQIVEFCFFIYVAFLASIPLAVITAVYCIFAYRWRPRTQPDLLWIAFFVLLIYFIVAGNLVYEFLSMFAAIRGSDLH